MDDKAAKLNRRRLRNAFSIFNRLSSELDTLRDWLAEIPGHLAEIETMEDEAARREAMVVVRDTMQRARLLHLDMSRTVKEFEQRLGPVDAGEDGSNAG